MKGAGTIGNYWYGPWAYMWLASEPGTRYQEHPEVAVPLVHVQASLVSYTPEGSMRLCSTIQPSWSRLESLKEPLTIHSEYSPYSIYFGIAALSRPNIDHIAMCALLGWLLRGFKIPKECRKERRAVLSYIQPEVDKICHCEEYITAHSKMMSHLVVYFGL